MEYAYRTVVRAFAAPFAHYRRCAHDPAQSIATSRNRPACKRAASYQSPLFESSDRRSSSAQSNSYRPPACADFCRRGSTTPHIDYKKYDGSTTPNKTSSETSVSELATLKIRCSKSHCLCDLELAGLVRQQSFRTSPIFFMRRKRVKSSRIHIGNAEFLPKVRKIFFKPPAGIRKTC